jgi:hypothetical protein
MRSRPATLGLFSAALLAMNGGAQEPAPTAQDEPAAGIEEVVVRGKRMSEIDDGLRIFIKDFIGEVVAKPPGRGYARWNRRVCIGVSNLQTGAAQYVIDRISKLAAEVGLAVGEPGCSPNVIIMFSANATFVATYMVENEPLLFRPAGLGNNDMSLSRAALDEFAASERAVRWWHVSLPVDARTGNPAIEIPGQGYPTIGVAGPSRIHDGIRDDLLQVIIIVDATKLAGTTWQQLADYLAVISLAQVDPKANPTAFDSILNLFSNPQAYSGLTDWDRSYVRALYEYDQERNVHLQLGTLVGTMLRDPEAQR